MATKNLTICARTRNGKYKKGFSGLINWLLIVNSASIVKRSRITTTDRMDPQLAKEKLAAAEQKYGREIRVFETTTSSQTSNEPTDNVADEPDEFYEFTAEDYYRILATKKEDKFLKTKKIREAEEAARRSRITKAVIRVRFPDNYTLEATFHPSETIQSLVDLLMKVLAQPDIPFCIYTTPPKKQIKDMSQDFYSAGFAPAAIVYFAYDQPKVDGGVARSDSFLNEDVMSLKSLALIAEQVKPEVDHATTTEPVVAAAPAQAQERKPAADKKMVKPKWLKM